MVHPSGDSKSKSIRSNIFRDVFFLLNQTHLMFFFSCFFFFPSKVLKKKERKTRKKTRNREKKGREKKEKKKMLEGSRQPCKFNVSVLFFLSSSSHSIIHSLSPSPSFLLPMSHFRFRLKRTTREKSNSLVRHLFVNRKRN